MDCRTEGADDRHHPDFDDPDAGVLTDVSSQGRPLLIAFGGIAGRLGMPPFEFFRLAASVPSNKVFVRDLRQAWYQRGVPGLGDGVEEMAEGLRAMIQPLAPERVVMTGNSAGGYAALLFGSLIPETDTVLAFSPQTFLGRARRLAHRDRRWRRQIAALPSSRQSRRYRDLRAVLRERPSHSSAEVFVAADDRLDRLHAHRIAQLPGVVVHEFSKGGHSLIRSLRDDGTLTTLLTDSLSGGVGGRPAGEVDSVPPA